ncbi:MAG TPA: hypothetical protein PLU85_01240 [Bacteroidia bacterium]|nr:hypothetical protein [Bacteroidia bacterium]MBP7713265.1 hypothetical protein [Bacteroidia bacterium]MBP8667186.1 hypothetical protein [Bacteroidia bacterium]HOZ89467.1 hypothetical protein [Bacteroidia bacterium]HQW17344.1 hypothetical protein [Bacteroidia bacterium]
MHVKIFSVLICIVLLNTNSAFAQGVGINNPTPDATALLDLTSTTKGLLIPRMMTFQRLSIPAPANGLMVYDITLNAFYYSDNGIWKPMDNSWQLNGNTATNPVTDFIGTTDFTPLVFRTNGFEAMRITQDGRIGINQPFSPAFNAILDIQSNDKGILIPRMSSPLRSNISSPPDGLLVYDSGSNEFYYSISSVWMRLLSNNTGWTTRGNAFTNPATDFIGTTDNTDLVFGTFGGARGCITSAGDWGIGTIFPSAKLHVQGSYRLEDGTQGLGKLLMSDATGNASWKTFEDLITGKVANGLYFNTIQQRILIGGALTENTTITNSAFDFTYDLTGAGDFQVTESSNPIPSLFVSGNKGGVNDGYVGIGTATPFGRFHINNTVVTTVNTQNTYHLLIGNGNTNPDLTFGASATFALAQSWNNKPLQINPLGTFVGINHISAAPIQNLDINGRLAVQNGVIQKGAATAILATDLGLYQQIAGGTIRISNNAGPIKFYTDQGGASLGGTNNLVSIDNSNGGGVKIHSEISGSGQALVPAARAALDVQSTTKGVLFPRMTTAQRNAILPLTAADEGLMIYNLTEHCINWWDTRPNSAGVPGFWNSQCQPCMDYFEYTASSNGNNFNTQAGSPVGPKTFCVTVKAGVTLGASAMSGDALNFGALPAGSKVILHNYGQIRGGGGKGGNGGSERDVTVCGVDAPATAGSDGGDAIVTSAGVQVTVYNYGTIASGGGGGGGGSGGCRSNGGSGGGGAGIPAGGGGLSPNTGGRASGGLCNVCTLAPASLAGANGTITNGGLGTCSQGNAGGGCSSLGFNGGCGGNGGGPGVNGNTGVGLSCGTAIAAAGGNAGFALQGNGSGSFIVNVTGTFLGIVSP